MPGVRIWILERDSGRDERRRDQHGEGGSPIAPREAKQDDRNQCERQITPAGIRPLDAQFALRIRDRHEQHA